MYTFDLIDCFVYKQMCSPLVSSLSVCACSTMQILTREIEAMKGMANGQCPGARFSKVPKSFRTRKAIAKYYTAVLFMYS